MQFQFECSCGAEISDHLRGETDEVSFRVQCDDCHESYVVTISPLGVGDPTRDPA